MMKQCGNGGAIGARGKAASSRALKAVGISRAEADAMSASELEQAMREKGISENLIEVEKNRKELGELKDSNKKKNDSPIKDYKKFEDEVGAAFDYINTEFNQRGLVEIGAVRKALGNRISEKQFDEFLFEMQSQGKIQLVGEGRKNKDGTMDYSQAPKGGVVNSLGYPRHHIQKIGNWTSSSLTDFDGGRKISRKAFEAEAMKSYERHAEKSGRLVSISDMRKDLNVNRRQFREYLLEMQASNKIELVGGGEWSKQRIADPRDAIPSAAGVTAGTDRMYVKKVT